MCNGEEVSSLIKDNIGARLVKDGVLSSFIHIFLNILSVLKHVLVSPVTQIWPILSNFGYSSHCATDGLIKPNTLIILRMITRCWHMITHSLWHFFRVTLNNLIETVSWMRGKLSSLVFFFSAGRALLASLFAAACGCFPSSKGWAAEAFWIMLMALVWGF